MLTCNNCFTVNEDGTERCRNCHMEGNFSHQDDAAKAGSSLEPEDNKAQCRNCGHRTPADALKCVECHFPLPHKAFRKTTESSPLVWRSLRAG